MSQTERDELLALFADSRVADVRDCMDWNMLHYQSSMAVDIHPLFRIRESGLTRPVRYLPFSGSMPRMTPDEYTQWSGWYY